MAYEDNRAEKDELLRLIEHEEVAILRAGNIARDAYQSMFTAERSLSIYRAKYANVCAKGARCPR